MQPPNTRLHKPKYEIDARERQRLRNMNKFERAARKNGFNVIAGVDEAGRGPLAGPVVAAACILPKGILIPGVDDSKKLTPERRSSLFEQITSDSRIQYGIGIVSHEEIDRINIFQATIQAMLQAIAKLMQQPDVLLVDGLKLPHLTIPCEKIIQGDAKSQSIAAASVLAKVTRDRLMMEFHQRWPQYGFEQHKGYATSMHLEAIEKHGPCDIHRMTFSPFKPTEPTSEQIEFVFTETIL